MICRKCNANIADNAKFCPKCGAKIELVETQGIQTKKCPSCGTENPISAKFCKADGYNLQEVQPTKGESPAEVEKPKDVIFCPQCKTPYPITARFCKNDGTPLKERVEPSFDRRETTEPTPHRVEARKVEKRGRKKWILIPILLFLIAAGVGGYLYFSGHIFKNQEKVQEEINTELREKGLNNLSTEINKEWVATVSGIVSNQSYREDALRIVRSHREVKEVIEHIHTIEEIEKEINNTLSAEGLGEVSAQIDKDFIVTLEGFVNNEDEKKKAIDIAKTHNELKNVKDNIRTTEEIAKEVNNALSAEGLSEVHAQIDQDLIVTLTGLVNNEGERTKAVDLAKGHSELKGVINNIRIKQVRTDNRAARIENELNSTLRKRGLNTIYAKVTQDLIAILKGSASSLQDKELALSIARSYRELRSVKDEIILGPVQPPPPPRPCDPAKLEGEINKALRNAGLMGVTAEVSYDFQVILKGSVMTEADVFRARKIAKDFQCVKDVKNKIFVVS